MLKPANRGAKLAVCLAFVACGCGVAASPTPLGGNYDAPELGTRAASDRRPPTPPTPTTPSESDSDAASDGAEPVKPKPAAAPVVADAQVSDDAVVYQPLKAGDRIEAEITIGFDSERSSGAPGPFGSGTLRMASRQRVELKVSQASAQALDELELTVTTLSMHLEFAGQTKDEKPEPPEVYRVTLGQSPSVRARNGSKPDAAARAVLLALVTPIAEFHAHWGPSPKLDLKPGWSSKVPVTLPSFGDAHSEVVKVGPLAVSYAGRDGDHVHFDVALPVQYGADMGTLDFDLTGQATLSANNGRPTSFDLNGPFKAQLHGGNSHAAPAFSGRTKFSATLRYR